MWDQDLTLGQTTDVTKIIIGGEDKDLEVINKNKDHYSTAVGWGWMLIILCNIISQIIRNKVGGENWTNLKKSNPDRPESQKRDPALQIDQQIWYKKENSNNKLELKSEAPMPVPSGTEQDELRLDSNNDLD